MSHKATPETLLKRFLYMSTERSCYISGNPEIHNNYQPDKLTCVTALLKGDLATNFVRNLFVSAGNEPLLSRRETLFFAAACFIAHKNANQNQRHLYYTLVLNMCRCNEDLFAFVKFLSKMKKPCSSGLQKVVSMYYFRQKPGNLIKCVTESNSYHGWTHKDLLKLIHCKTDDQAIEVIIKYILYGEAKAVETAGEDAESLKILEHVRKVKEFRTCDDENKAIQLISELNIRHMEQLPPTFMKSQTVWGALIPQLSLSDLINSLPKLYKMGFLKTGTLQKQVIDILTDIEIVNSSNIHPVEVYIGLKNLEKGGKPKDPHLVKYLESKEDVEAKLLADPDYKRPDFAYQEPAKCAGVISALQKTLTNSFGNLKTISKRFLITIGMSEKMEEPCLTTKNVTCSEAAVLTAYCIFKANKIVTVAVFKGNTITPIQMEKNITLALFQKKINEAKRGIAMWSTPFDWASNTSKAFDVFIHMGAKLAFLELTKEDREKDKPKEAFSNYMKKMNLPHTKLIACSFNMHNAAFSEGATNILDVCGFDKHVPNVIDAFSKNLF